MTILKKVANLNWVAVVLFPLAVILMEVSWLYPWLTLVGNWPAFVQQRPPLSLVSLIFLLSAAFLITRVSISRRWSLRQARLSIIASGIVAIFVVLRIEYATGSGLLDRLWYIHTAQLLIDSFSHPHPVVIALAVGLYLWWRGIGWGHSPLFFDTVYRSFSIGIIAQVALILAWGTDSLNNLMSTTGLYVAGFFFFGLSALALAKLQGMQEQGEERVVSPAFSARWLSLIVVVIGGIILVGIGVASIFSTDFLSVLGQLFNLVSGLLFQILSFFLIIVGFLIAISFYIVQTIINMLQQKQPAQPFSSANLTVIEELKQGISRASSSEALLAIKWVFFGLVITAVLFLLARAILHYRSFWTKEEVEEIHESLWSWEGFLSDLRLFLSLLWQRFRSRIKQVLPQASLTGRYQRVDMAGRLSIREIYQRLLWQASQLGIARRHYETPYEYGKRLGEAVPEGSAPLSELTDLYLKVRYGDLAAQTRQTDYANNLWGVLQKLLGGVETNQTE